MIDFLAKWLERRFNIRQDRAQNILYRLVVVGAASLFLFIATLIVAFENIFVAQGGVATLEVGMTAQTMIYSPTTTSFVSQTLTAERRKSAEDAVRPIYYSPDPSVARQQAELARQILDYIANVRADTFASDTQQFQDIEYITALDLERSTITQLLDFDDETWREVDAECIAVLERVMRGEIQSGDLSRIRGQLPTQVSVRFDERETAVIVDMVGDLIRANATINEDATASARRQAGQAVTNVIRFFERGQLVVSSGQVITPSDYEALNQLGLLRPVDKRLQETVRAGLGSIITMVMVGLYLSRFRPSLLYSEPRLLTLLAVLFLIILGGARVALSGEFYIYPAAALALIYVAIAGHQIAIIGVIALAFLVGLMTGSVYEDVALVLIGGIIGTLALRRSERLNSFFFAGGMVSLGYIAVAISFVITSTDPNRTSELLLLIIYSFVNGILTAAATIAAMYIITLLFNLPTALKMIELSQPNQPLLQRLLREAPGTYQHSLQVANLCDQAANAIGADAQLIHVAALYHDIGKMLNPAFFTENQGEMGNPHDALNDPYRSAEIIISHVIGGDELAKQYRLPNRIRDFIREHHGTQEVYVFYQQALALADGNASQVDSNDFRYPGPKPQTRETAIMMLADGAEASVRARQPKNKGEIEEIVRDVIEARRKSGQLNESSLTLNDLQTIHKIFVEMLQAVFHPRINYAEAVARVRKPAPTPPTSIQTVEMTIPVKETTPDKRTTGEMPIVTTKPPSSPSLPKVTVPLQSDDDDDAPLREVPRLKKPDDNGKSADKKEVDKTNDTH
ncbi:MAG: HDIG domain-containing protein [Anaerolineae bacterium]|jgi:hypothetical protein|nr:HDIG domain-containing protein [Anaerolineae bacterium]